MVATRSMNPDFDLTDSPDQRNGVRCTSCGDPIQNSSCISCASCSRWTHAKKACSQLSPSDAKQEAKIKAFLCSQCKVTAAPDPTAAAAAGDAKAIGAAVCIILHELRECKKQLSMLHETNLALTRENATIKSSLTALQKQLSSAATSQSAASSAQYAAPFPRPSRESSGSSRLKRQQSASRDRSNGRRPASIRRIDSRAPLPRIKIPSNRTKRSNQNRTPNTHIVSEASYGSEESKEKLLKALPLTTVKYCTRHAFLTLYNSSATAANVLTHLRNSRYDVLRVHQIRAKSRSDNYRCFAIECSDLDFDDICSDEKLWHPGTVIGEMINDPTPERIVDTASVA